MGYDLKWLVVVVALLARAANLRSTSLIGMLSAIVPHSSIPISFAPCTIHDGHDADTACRSII